MRSEVLPNELQGITGKLKKMLLLVWKNPGIKTHEVNEVLRDSNNRHMAVQHLRQHLSRVGWSLSLKPVNGKNRSHAWYIEKK